MFGTAETSQNGNTAHGSQNGGPNQTMSIMPMPVTGAPVGVPGPTTNLNIGMDYWGGATSSAIPALRGKSPSTPVAGGMVTTGSRESMQSQLWLQVIFYLFFSSLSSPLQCVILKVLLIIRSSLSSLN